MKKALLETGKRILGIFLTEIVNPGVILECIVVGVFLKKYQPDLPPIQIFSQSPLPIG